MDCACLMSRCGCNGGSLVVRPHGVGTQLILSFELPAAYSMNIKGEH